MSAVLCSVYYKWIFGYLFHFLCPSYLKFEDFHNSFLDLSYQMIRMLHKRAWVVAFEILGDYDKVKFSLPGLGS